MGDPTVHVRRPLGLQEPSCVLYGRPRYHHVVDQEHRLPFEGLVHFPREQHFVGANPRLIDLRQLSPKGAPFLAGSADESNLPELLLLAKLPDDSLVH